MAAMTLYDKLWASHVVDELPDGSTLLYIDRQLLHEVTSAQAFAALEHTGRAVRRSAAQLAVEDHNVPTTGLEVTDPLAQEQLAALRRNTKRFGIVELAMGDRRQGIVHVVGPEQGFTLPGITIVCGDSHTSTHGAFGALAFGIGTSEVAHCLATQCLVARKSQNMRIMLHGTPHAALSAKDVILGVIGRLGTAAGTGAAVEYAGPYVEQLSMEGRMTLCNMAIEMGARVGLCAVDETTIAYLENRPMGPRGKLWEQAVAFWRTLHSDAAAQFDREASLDVSALAPQVTWGTSPEQVIAIDERIPDPAAQQDGRRREAMQRALDYMGLKPGQALTDVAVDQVFIGSCTNGRIEDLRCAAAVVAGRRVAPTVRRAMVVPGSGEVRLQAEQEGLDRLFREAGFEWRLPGCSMCLGMNEDRLASGERCAATSNRNFEGRQGAGGRTHLVSPAMAAAAAIAGHFVDVRHWP